MSYHDTFINMYFFSIYQNIQILHFVILWFQITEVQNCSDDSPVKFSSEVVFYVDRYEIV